MPSPSRISKPKYAQPICPNSASHLLPKILVTGYSPELIQAALVEAADRCHHCHQEREIARVRSMPPEELRAQARRNAEELWG